MKLLFCGTPEFARVILEAIFDRFSNTAKLFVITSPARPAGRGMRLIASPVAQFAEEHDLPVFTPQTLKEDSFAQTLNDLSPDLCVVAAYGKILPEYFLAVPKFGCINVHASLLPEYRGAAPIERALLDGKDLTGITIMQMDKGLDTGDILLQESLPITKTDTGKSLTEKLSILGSQLVVTAIDKVLDGSIQRLRQDDSLSTYAQKLSRTEERIDWSRSVLTEERRVRAFAPRPCASAILPDGEELKICQAVPHTENKAKNPGTVRLEKKRVFVSCMDGELELLRVKPQGKGEMDAVSLINGRKLQDGDRLL